jgi:phosphoribosylanthranilate isomerase
MLRPKIKVCCITSIAEARIAIDAGADALGLVSDMPSGPGVISEELIAEIAATVPQGVATFLLTSLQSAEEIVMQHLQCGTTTIQLVDHVPPEDLRALRQELPEVELVQVIHVGGEESVAEALTVSPLVDALLLDTGNRQLPVKELGGTGRTHDWRVSSRIREATPLPVYLAGGLCATNVVEAIETVGPHGLDLCSGLRTNDLLDVRKVAEFFAVVRAAC